MSNLVFFQIVCKKLRLMINIPPVNLLRLIMFHFMNFKGMFFQNVIRFRITLCFLNFLIFCILKTVFSLRALVRKHKSIDSDFEIISVRVMSVLHLNLFKRYESSFIEFIKLTKNK